MEFSPASSIRLICASSLLCTQQHCKNLWHFCDTAHTFVTICWKLNRKWHNMRSRISPSLKYCYCVILSVLDLIHNQGSYHQPIALPSWHFSLRTLFVIRFQCMAIPSRHDTQSLYTECDPLWQDRQEVGVLIDWSIPKLPTYFLDRSTELTPYNCFYHQYVLANTALSYNTYTLSSQSEADAPKTNKT